MRAQADGGRLPVPGRRHDHRPPRRNARQPGHARDRRAAGRPLPGAAARPVPDGTQPMTEERFPCNCARGNCAISVTGDVQPCVSVPWSAGNVREQPFIDIWRYSPVFQKIRGLRIADYEACAPCPDKSYCSRNRGAAFNHSGSYTGTDPFVCKTAAITREVVTSHAADDVGNVGNVGLTRQPRRVVAIALTYRLKHDLRTAAGAGAAVDPGNQTHARRTREAVRLPAARARGGRPARRRVVDCPRADARARGRPAGRDGQRRALLGRPPLQRLPLAGSGRANPRVLLQHLRPNPRRPRDHRVARSDRRRAGAAGRPAGCPGRGRAAGRAGARDRRPHRRRQAGDPDRARGGDGGDRGRLAGGWASLRAP